MMNLSHAAVKCGDLSIQGYKAAGNFQRCLTDMWLNRHDKYDHESYALLALVLKPSKAKKVAA